MKKIIGFLFFLLLSVCMFYGVFYLRSLTFYNLLFEGHTFIELAFDEDLEAYHTFLSLAEEKSLTVSRVVHPNADTTIIYTTDVTLNGKVQLLEGEFPPTGSSYFISPIDMKDDSQIGIMVDIVPDVNLMIWDLNRPESFGIDGQYQINTNNQIIIENFIQQLQEDVHYIHIIDDLIPIRILRVFLSISPWDMSTNGLLVVEVIAILPVLTLCVLLALIQYVLNYMKSSAIFLTHGYDKNTVSKKIFKDIFKIWLKVTSISYISLILYLSVISRMIFLNSATIFFLILTSSLIITCLIIVYMTVFISLHFTNLISLLKGQRVDKALQVINHCSKFFFTCIFLYLSMLSLSNLTHINERLTALSYWENAENIYRIAVVPRVITDEESLTRYDSRRVAFYRDILTYNGGFMINSAGIRIVDMYRAEEEQWGALPFDLHILEKIENVSISPSFLKINPIYTIDGLLAYDVLILDGFTLNILLPEWLLDQETEIYEALLDIYSKADRINIIYVHDEQVYFSFDRNIRPDYGNRILDPFAIIYDEQLISDFLISGLVTSSLYFTSETNNAFSEIEELIHRHRLQTHIQWIEAVYDDNVREIRNFQDHQVRLTALLILLLIANFSVVYHLIANYFERYKFDIFLKSTFGWNIFKQNKWFFVIYLSYSLPLIILMSSLLGGYIFFIGISILALDIAVMLLFQRRLLKKSFAEIMKGER